MPENRFPNNELLETLFNIRNTEVEPDIVTNMDALIGTVCVGWYPTSPVYPALCYPHPRPKSEKSEEKKSKKSEKGQKSEKIKKIWKKIKQSEKVEQSEKNWKS